MKINTFISMILIQFMVISRIPDTVVFEENYWFMALDNGRELATWNDDKSHRSWLIIPNTQLFASNTIISVCRLLENYNGETDNVNSYRDFWILFYYYYFIIIINMLLILS